MLSDIDFAIPFCRSSECLSISGHIKIYLFDKKLTRDYEKLHVFINIVAMLMSLMVASPVI